MSCGKSFAGGQTGCAEAGCEIGALGFGSSVHRVVGSPSKCVLPSLPLWGREMAPHPLLMASLRWMCFSKGKTLAQPVNLLDANAAEDQKSGHKLGAICVLAARGWCWEEPATFPGTTICFPQAEGGSDEFNGSAICLQSF